MRHLSCAVASALLILVPVLAPSECRAETEGESLFRQGVEAFEKQDYASACPLFDRSFEAGHAASARYMLGQCEEKRGHLVAARAHYDWVAHDDQAKQDVRDHATENIAALDARIARVTLELGADAPAKPKIEIDGVEVEDLSKPWPVDPGEHRVVARAAGRADKNQTVTAAEGATVSFKVTFGDPIVEKPVRVEPVVTHPLRVPGWVLFGIGAAGLVGAGITGGVILSECGGLSDCPSMPGADGGARVKTDGQVQLEVANGVLWVAGGALVATGLSLIIADQVTGGSVRESARVSVRVGVGAVELAGRF